MVMLMEIPIANGQINLATQANNLKYWNDTTIGIKTSINRINNRWDYLLRNATIDFISNAIDSLGGSSSHGLAGEVQYSGGGGAFSSNPYFYYGNTRFSIGDINSYWLKFQKTGNGFNDTIKNENSFVIIDTSNNIVAKTIGRTLFFPQLGGGGNKLLGVDNIGKVGGVSFGISRDSVGVSASISNFLVLTTPNDAVNHIVNSGCYINITAINTCYLGFEIAWVDELGNATSKYLYNLQTSTIATSTYQFNTVDYYTIPNFTVMAKYNTDVVINIIPSISCTSFNANISATLELKK